MQDRAGSCKGSFAAFLLVLVVALGALFDRTWRFGEVFSPADLLHIYYPWSYDQSRRDPANPTRSDEAFYHQPLMVTHWERLRDGDFPHRDPLVLSGTAAFHQGLDVGRAVNPLSAPFYLLPPDLAVTAYAPLRLLCAALLMWLYLAHAGLSAPARAAGALAFAFNGAFIVWLSAPMPTVALWLPLLALAVERVCTRRRLSDAALLALAVGLQFIGAYLPTSLVVLTVTAAWSAGWLAAGDESSGTPVRAGFGRVARRTALLLVGTFAGALLASVALWPMLSALVDSPASQRSMRPFTLPIVNAVTFAVPNFWGTPLLGNWWYRRPGNYPEMVTYLGIVTVSLACAGVLVTARRRDRRGLLAILVALFAAMQMYGIPPVSWTSALPGFRQMNPYRWNVALAFAVALLAALGTDGLARPRGRRWILPLSAGIGLAALLGTTALAFLDQLPGIRQLGLQPFERQQLARLVVVTSGCALLLTLFQLRQERVARAAAWLVALALGADLVHAARGFNPTLPRDALYPSAPGIEIARAERSDGRVAPVGASNQLVEGHVWGLFGLPTVTGFDFGGDADYQRFLARAAGERPREARWDYVGIPGDASPDLRLLGLLGTSLVITPPTDLVSEGAGYRDLGELRSGRLVVQSFVARQGGLRRIEVLAGTYDRQNDGTLAILLRREDDGAVVARREVRAAAVRNLDWLRIDFPEQGDSRSRRYRLEIAGDGPAGRVPTVLATASSFPGATLTVDGAPAPGSLWMRTYTSAPDRFPGAKLLYAHDLNIYRNPLARPPAWFVEQVVAVPAGQHLDAVSRPDFDPARIAVIEARDPLPPSSSSSYVGSSSSRTSGDPERSAVPARAQVLAYGEDTPDRLTYRVAAPRGGWLLFRERFHEGWTLRAADPELPLVRADAVLMAAWIPPGVTDLTLDFTLPGWGWARALSVVALLGISVAFLTRR
jgi:hypothetical protein